MINNGFERYKKFLPIVIFTVFALIFIGSMVRSTGSGMGCPDWPRCFGKLIPPTHIDQLPLNYKEIYKVSGRQIADFSATKTWTEYMNRLFGAWTGIASLILVFLSFKIRKTHSKINILSFVSLFLVVLNGWLGSKVVQTHLHPGTITLHMFLAMMLVFFLLKLKYEVNPPELVHWDKRAQFSKVALMLLIGLFVQILLGTQVREQVDHLTNTHMPLDKQDWLNQLDYVFYIHRTFSIVLLLGFSHLIRNIHRAKLGHAKLLEICNKLILTLFAEIAAGAVIVYFHFPGIAQSLHLILSILMISYIYEIVIYLRLTANGSKVSITAIS